MTSEAIAIQRSSRDLTVRSLLNRYGLTNALKNDVTDVEIIRPLEYWVKSSERRWQSHANEHLTLSNLNSLATAIAVFNKATLDQDHAIGSYRLPNGERCQIVVPPVAHDGHIIFSIRKPSKDRFSLSDYQETGRLSPALASQSDSIQNWEQELTDLSEAGNYKDFFKKAVDHRLNIVTVGGTGSGKTTFSKTLLDLYPKDRRLGIIEDNHELDTPKHKNSFHLFFSEQYPAKQVLASCMRLNPDHLFITEIRGDETWDYLMAIKSGHAGSITSVHANDCLGGLYKIGSYVKQSDVGKGLTMEYIMQEVLTTIDVLVYFEDTYMKEIYYDPERKLELLKGSDQ